jgi:hypothetical protein
MIIRILFWVWEGGVGVVVAGSGAILRPVSLKRFGGKIGMECTRERAPNH